MTLDSSSVTVLLGLTLIVPQGLSAAPSGFSVDFQVENKLDFLTTGGTCRVLNNPPVFSVTTDAGTTSFEPP